MRRNEKISLNKRQIITIGCKPLSGVIFCPAVVNPNKKRPLPKPRKPRTHQKRLRDCSKQLRLSLQSSPISSQDRRQDQEFRSQRSIVEEISDLKWIFDNELWSQDQAWKRAEKNKEGAGRTQEQRYSEPTWSQPPTRSPLRAIDEYLRHLADLWRSMHPLQISESWKVFENVNWGQNGCFELGLTDSEPDAPTYPLSSGSSGSPPDASNVSPQPMPCKTTITCRGTHLTQSRARGHWNTVAAMNPAKFAWKYQTEDRAFRRNQTRHTGCVDFNQHARNHDMCPQNSFPAVISHWDANVARGLLPNAHELSSPRMLGRWLVAAVETELFPARCEQSARWPKLLRRASDSPVVDYICRATSRSIGWHEELCPVLFAAQFDPREDYYRQDKQSAAWRLASVFQPMMTIFILYYLDTRICTDDPMPPWMVLFGIYYNENGVIIRAHSPCFKPSADSLPDIHSGWRATSLVVEADYRWAMLEMPDQRGPLLSTLNRIQGHCVHVLERLKAWGGYERACQLLTV